MTNPIFYIDSKTLDKLIASEYDSPQEPFDLTVEFTDIPYWAVMHALKTRTTVTVYRRNEIHSPSEKVCKPLGKVTNFRKENVKVSAAPEIANNIGPLYWGCLLICDLVRKNHPEIPEKAADPQNKNSETNINSLGDYEENYTGYLIKNTKKKWQITTVRGKERPDLMVSGIFCGEVMARPYMEDVFERDMKENA